MPGPHRLAFVAVAVLAAVFWLTSVDDSSDVQEETEPAAAEMVADPVVAGRVVDQDGMPVVGAGVDVGGETVETDAEGRFAVSSLAEGTHVIDIEADGHIRPGIGDAGRPSVAVADGETVDELEFVVQESVELSGRVVARGKPVRDVGISLSYEETTGVDGTPLEPFVRENAAATDGQGRFSVSGVEPGRLEVVAERAGETVASEPLEVEAGEHREEITVDLTPSGVFRGRVVGPSGDPVGAELRMTAAYADEPSRVVHSGDDGAFVIQDLAEGLYRLEVEAEDYRTETVEGVHIRPDQPADRHVELEPDDGAGATGPAKGPDVASASGEATVETSVR